MSRRYSPKVKREDDKIPKKIRFHFIDESPGKPPNKFIKIVLETTKISELPYICLRTEKKATEFDIIVNEELISVDNLDREIKTFDNSDQTILIIFKPKIIEPPIPKTDSSVSESTTKKDDTEKLALLSAENTRLRDELDSLQRKNKELQSELEKFTNKNKFDLEILTQETVNSLNEVGVIGQGSQSEVKKVTRSEEYALKVLKAATNLLKSKISKMPSEAKFDIANVKHLLQEYEILHSLHHPNIIETFGFCYGDEKHPPSILLQFCPYNLCDVVGDMTNIEKVCSIYEISLAMSAVHEAGLIHRDLKPANILIDTKKHVRVSDFGVSCVTSVESQTQSMTSVGTLKFMAPELLNEARKYNNKVDVYSFGVVVFIILTGGELPRISIAEQSNGKQAEIPKEINEISRNLISKCWSKDADDRPSFKDIIDYIETNKFKLIDGIEKEIDEIKKFLSI